MVKTLLASCSAPKKVCVEKSNTVSAGFTNEDKKVIEGDKMQTNIANAVKAFGLTAVKELIAPTPIVALGKATLAAIDAYQGR